MPSTPRTSTPYPAGSDAPLGPAQMQALAENLEKYGIPRFASSAARDAAIPSPTEGDFCYRTDTDRLEMYTGAAWIGALPFGPTGNSYTPTLVNITIGTGGTPLNTGRWERMGNYVDVEAIVQLGTTGFSVSTGFTISLPIAMDTGFTQTSTIIGTATFSDATGPLYQGATVAVGTSAVETRYLSTSTSTSHASLGQAGATLPFTWAAGDRITMKARYRAA